MLTLGENKDFYHLVKPKYALMFLGLGEIIGSFFMGYMVDKYGSRISAIINVIGVHI